MKHATGFSGFENVLSVDSSRSKNYFNVWPGSQKEGETNRRKFFALK